MSGSINRRSKRKGNKRLRGNATSNFELLHCSITLNSSINSVLTFRHPNSHQFLANRLSPAETHYSAIRNIFSKQIFLSTRRVLLMPTCHVCYQTIRHHSAFGSTDLRVDTYNLYEVPASRCDAQKCKPSSYYPDIVVLRHLVCINYFH